MKRLVAAVVLAMVSAAVSATAVVTPHPNDGGTFEWGAPSYFRGLDPRALSGAVVYAIELRFAIPDPAYAPSSDVVAEGCCAAGSAISAARDRTPQCPAARLDFHAVLFMTAGSEREAAVVSGIIGLSAAAAIPAIRFAGARPWPGTGDLITDADAQEPV